MNEIEREDRMAEPAVDLELVLPAGPLGAGESEIPTNQSLKLASSLVAEVDSNGPLDCIVHNIIDVLGSAVAESAGWRPPEAMEDDHGRT